MKAFIVHDTNKQRDLLVVPETDTSVVVDRVIMEAFISVKPDFSSFSGSPVNGLPVETFGQIIATRSPEGDVCIVDEGLWQERMAVHLGSL